MTSPKDTRSFGTVALFSQVERLLGATVTTAQQNRLLTQVEPGAPLHGLMKRYWIPAERSGALEAGGAPRLVRLLGEEYVAFRADDGRVGFFDAHCPHRGAPLVLARNEDCALRCLYHGWKIDVAGKVVEVPSEPPERRQQFAEKVRVRWFPVRESGGLVWVWLGGAEPDEFPTFEFDGLTDPQVWALAIPTECNWLQAVEGNYDAAHSGVLHATTINRTGQLVNLHGLMAPPPRWDLVDRRYGMVSAALYEIEDDQLYVRANQYVFPFGCFVSSDRTAERLAFLVTPVDDEHCVQWTVIWHPDKPVPSDGFGATFVHDLDPDWDNPRASMPPSDLWGQDRTKMATSFTGMRGAAIEDLSQFEGQGLIASHAREHLGMSDQSVIHLRRIILDAIVAFEAGTKIPGADPDFPFRTLRGQSEVVKNGEDWQKKIYAPASV